MNEPVVDDLRELCERTLQRLVDEELLIADQHKVCARPIKIAAQQIQVRHAQVAGSKRSFEQWKIAQPAAQAVIETERRWISTSVRTNDLANRAQPHRTRSAASNSLCRELGHPATRNRSVQTFDQSIPKPYYSNVFVHRAPNFSTDPLQHLRLVRSTEA